MFGASLKVGLYGVGLKVGLYGASLKVGVYGASLKIALFGASLEVGLYGASLKVGLYGASLKEGLYGASLKEGLYGASLKVGLYGASLKVGLYEASFMAMANIKCLVYHTSDKYVYDGIRNYFISITFILISEWETFKTTKGEAEPLWVVKTETISMSIPRNKVWQYVHRTMCCVIVNCFLYFYYVYGAVL